MMKSRNAAYVKHTWGVFVFKFITTKSAEEWRKSAFISVIWLLKFLQSKASAEFWLHSCKSPLFESHSFPCGCLATPLQHNIVRINRVKHDRCLLKTTSQGCSPIMEAALSTAAIRASDLIQLSWKSTQKTSCKVNSRWWLMYSMRLEGRHLKETVAYIQTHKFFCTSFTSSKAQ